MKMAKICSSEPMTLVGGGEIGEKDLQQALNIAPFLVAVDSGASYALSAGHDPSAVVGDFDSLDSRDKAQIPEDRLFPISEQDTTDFDKALSNVSAPVILAVGFLGGRIDHQLAAFSALVHQPNCPCILIGPGEIVFHVPANRTLTLELAPDDVVSLFPMRLVSGRSKGLKWSIDGLILEPGGRIGTSNRALGPVDLETDSSGLLAIVPRTALQSVMQAIQVTPSSEPGL